MLACKTADDIIGVVREKEVAFVQFWFSDVLGQLKSFSITASELTEAFEEGGEFDGSSIMGFARIEESDMVAVPDPATFQLLAWRPQEQPVGRMFCDILTPDRRGSRRVTSFRPLSKRTSST